MQGVSELGKEKKKKKRCFKGFLPVYLGSTSGQNMFSEYFLHIIFLPIPFPCILMCLHTVRIDGKTPALNS